ASGPGLQEVLAGTAALEQAVQPTAQPGLAALSAGAVAPSPRAEAAEATRWILAWLRARYDLIFVDGPPAGETGEVASLLSGVDAVYLVVDHGDAGRPEVRAAQRQIARLGGHVSGLILTR